jgi:hypothetical protein
MTERAPYLTPEALRGVAEYCDALAGAMPHEAITFADFAERLRDEADTRQRRREREAATCPRGALTRPGRSSVAL